MHFSCWCVVVDGRGYILARGRWKYIILGVGGWWWVVVDIWVVVDGGGWLRMVVGSSGWWWVVLDGGIV